MKKMLFASLLFLAFSAHSASYKIDPVHSHVGFSVKHMVISKVKGHFSKFEGTFNFDEKKSEVTKVDIKIDPASIDTGERKRDDHLNSPDFFDVKKFPEMKFKSDKVVVVKPGQTVAITGDLTMHGVTKPVTMDLTYGGTVTDPMGKERAGFTLAGKINRKDWGLNWNKTLDKGGVTVSDEVNVEVDGEAIKDK